MAIQHEGQERALSGVEGGNAVLRDELRNLSIRVAQQVASVHGIVTKAEADRLDYLRDALGMDYDAINGRWRLYPHV